MLPTQLNSSPPENANEETQIRIFAGDERYKGISVDSLQALAKVVQQLQPNHLLERCFYQEMNLVKWGERDILIFPGGRCSDWNELLSEKKQLKIFDWVKKGGRICAICAGAYYCSARSSYEKIQRIRNIALFSGECQGPIYSNTIKVVKVRWEENNQEGYVTMIQGGRLLPDVELSQECEALARFTEEPHQGEIAVIACRKGEGLAILSTCHWELDAEDLEGLKHFFPQAQILEQQSNLKKSQQFRQQCLRDIFDRLFM